MKQDRAVTYQGVLAAVSILVSVIVVLLALGWWWMVRPASVESFLRIGMMRNELIRRVDTGMVDLMDTQHCDQIIDRRSLFGCKRWRVLTIRYAGPNLRIASIQRELVNPDKW